jgi:hypothetical protein
MTRKEQARMTRYAEQHGYAATGVHSESNNSYGVSLQPIGVIYWDAANMKERIDDRERETKLYAAKS